MNNCAYRSRRDGLVAAVHVAKKKVRVCSRCGSVTFGRTVCESCGRVLHQMPDCWYRSVLEELTGKDSCSLMEEEELRKVMDYFNQAGFSQLPYVSPRSEQRKQDAAVRAQILRRAAEVLGDNWEARLSGFVAKMGKTALYSCGSRELRKVIGWINRIDRYDRKGDVDERERD